MGEHAKTGGPAGPGVAGGPDEPAESSGCYAYLEPDEPTGEDRSARAASLRSRSAVHARDRNAWLALFRDDALVADPVGPSPLDESGQGHRGKAAIGRFWDDVIAPNPVRMELRASRAGGNEVANELTISTTFPDGTRAVTDVVALYEVDETGLIRSLRAFWELDQLRVIEPG